MNCIVCESKKNTVTDSRKSNTLIVRRRKCIDCGERWTTEELLKERKVKQISHAEFVISLLKQAIKFLEGKNDNT